MNEHELDTGVFDEHRLLLIAKRVRHLRQRDGYTQESLAGAIEANPRTIKNIEAGVKVSLETYSAIASVFNYGIDRLISNDIRHYIDDLQIFVDVFVRKYNNEYEENQIKLDGLVEQVFNMDDTILNKLESDYFEFGKKKVAFFNAIGLYLKYEIDDYITQLEGMGMKREQALSFLHMFYLNILKYKTAAVGIVNMEKMEAFYRELFIRTFPP